MTKRILSLLVVLAMLVSVMPISAVTAEVSDPTATRHTHSNAHACSEQCSGGTVTWTAWQESDKLPTDSGHYYLTGDVQMAAAIDVAAGKDITICLNGYNVRAAAGKRHARVYGKLTVADCTAYTDENGDYVSGALTGGAVNDVGGSINVFRGTPAGGTFVLESGKLTGNSSTSKGGAVYMQKGTSAGNGGAFYMYGGEISHNTAATHGGGLYADGANDSYGHPQVHIYGGAFRGNRAESTKTGEGTGGAICLWGKNLTTVENAVIEGNTSSHGALYAQTTCTVSLKDVTITGNLANSGKTETGVYIAGGTTELTVSGKVVISGNAGNKDLAFNNKSNPGLKVNGLTDGTQIQMIPHKDATTFIGLASGGKQDDWSAHWVTSNGQSVSRVDGAFVLGHYHGNVKYEPWVGSDAHNTLPNGTANYYLANDILRNTNGGTVTIGKSVTQRMCLNGHTITHRNPAGRLYVIQGTFILEDCSAYTDGEGNYISGGITYGGATASTQTYGALFNLQSGQAARFTMENGQIYGMTNSAKNYEAGVAVYIQGASTAKAKAVFTMNGGMIHSINTLGDGAAVHLAVVTSDADAENPSEFNMNGGKILNNTTTGTGFQGGRGAIYASHAKVTVTGGEITGNTVKAGGAVYVEPTTQLSLSGAPRIQANNGGNLYLAGEAVIALGTMTGGKVGISAAKVSRAVSTQQTPDPTAYFESDDSEVVLKYTNNCLYLGTDHEHGIDGKAGNVGFSKWTSTNSLPTSAGNYYLANDVVLSATFTLKADVKLCLNGKTVTAANGKRILSVGMGGTLTVTDCCDACGTLTGGTSDYGAAINVNRGGVMNLYNGHFTGNTSGMEGGAVYLQGSNATEPGGVFNMYGGKISGNTAKLGGAVAMASSADQQTASAFNLYGGTIENNSANRGGAVFSYTGGTVNLHGGKITNNTATGAGGGLFVPGDMGSVTVSGAPVVKDNKSGTQSDNIHLVGDMIVTAGELTDGAQLFVTAEKCDRAVTNQVTEAEAGRFYSDSAYRMIVYKDSKVYFEISDEHVHCTCFYKTGGCDHTEVKWQAWESTTTLPTSSGNYYLLSDIQLAESATIPADQDVRICLNGKTVTGTRLILIRKDTTLSITDCVGTGTITGGDRNYGGAVNVNRMATLNLYGGTITGNTAGITSSAASLGGGVYLQAGKTGEPGAIFNMYGGTISKNSGYQGGGIYVAAGETADAVPAKLNIYGGTISGNTAGGQVTNADGTVSTKGGSGAAIYVGKYGVITMEGGTVTGHNGVAYGSTVYLSGATGKFSGGSITGNVSAKDGGGLYAVSASQVEITGNMTISNNKTVSGAGGGMGFSGKSQVVMSGGTVSGNYAGQGGGVIVQSGAAMQLTGGTIKNNESRFYAGGIYVNVPNADGTSSSLKMSGGSVTGNKSGSAAGGIYGKQAKVEITDGTISYNYTKNFGCGVYLHTCDSVLTGGRIVNNTSGKDGAGGYFYAGKIQLGGSLLVSGNVSEKGAGGGLGFTRECQATMYGGTITGNNAPYGGGVIVQGKAHLVMSGGTISNNVAKSGGGGIYVNTSSTDIRGSARIKGNSTERYGGGIYSNNSTVTVTGATVSGNAGKAGSGGMHALKGDVTVKDAVFAENSTDVAGGAICATRGNLLMENTVVEKNTANNGGGVLIQNYAKAILNDMIIRDNTASEASGMQVYSNVEVTMNGGEITGNRAITKLNKSGQTVGGRGAGILLNSGRSTYSGRSDLYLNGVTIEDNTAAANGAGIYVDMQMVAYLDGCTVQNNTAGGSGAGIYQASGTKLFVKNSKLLANTAETTGSAIYAGSDFTLENSTVTGNKTTDGAAVYVAPARYDGHSYMNAMIKFGGDLQLCDNEGTQSDLYLDEGVAAALTAEGFGKNTKISVQLHSGVLTNSILGVYDYKGGDLVYTITYGDRSLTDPEYVEPTKPAGAESSTQQDAPAKTDAVLYVGIGIVGLLAIAAVVLVALKKKKAGKPAEEATKE